MISSQAMQKLRTSVLLENDFTYTLNIEECKYQYQVFERVFTTIARLHNMNWKDIFNSNPKQKEKYLLLCISSILIDKLLRIEFRLSINDRELLLGHRMNDIVRDYYKFL